MADTENGGKDVEEQLGVMDPATFFPVSIRGGQAYLNETPLAGFSVEDAGEIIKVRIEYWAPKTSEPGE